LLFGGALLVAVFFIILFLVGFKTQAKDAAIGHDFGQTELNYKLTTFLRLPVGQYSVADLLAQKYYGQDVDGAIEAAAEGFFKVEYLCWEIKIQTPDDNKWRFVHKKSVKCPFGGEEAAAAIPTADGKVVNVMLWLPTK
jgi:hypothetical protein